MIRPRVSAVSGCLALALALVPGALAGCGGNNPPCNDCPQLAGSWSVSFDPGELAAECTATDQALPSGPLALTQVGSSLRGTLGGAELQGTLFQSWDYNLTGTLGEGAEVATVSTSGRFAQGQAALETTDRLIGTYTATWPGANACLISRSYVATRAQ